MQRQIYEYHPLIGYRFVPNLTARMPHEGGGFLIMTNNAGFRCEHDFTSPKPPGVFRILLFGDSYTAGSSVSNQFRYSDLLEKNIDGLEVFNFGLPGTGTDQHYLIFKEFAKNLEYDLLMICPLVENIRRVISRYRATVSRETGKQGYLAKPYFKLVNGELVLHHNPVPKGILQKGQLPLSELKHVDHGGRFARVSKIVNTYLRPFKPMIQAFTKYEPVPFYNKPDNEAWLIMKAIILKWISESKNRPVLICPIPLYYHIEQIVSPENYQQRFQEFSDIEGTNVFDVLPRFLAESPDNRRRCRFKNDQHFTIYGHQVLADALVEIVTNYMKNVLI